MKGRHDIYVMKVGNEYRVRPAVWSSDGQKEKDDQGKEKAPGFRIRNLTDKRVLVVLPTGILESSQAGELILQPARTQEKPQTEDCKTATLAETVVAAAPGVYPYSVFVFTDDGPVKASGESEPVVIIDPPPV